MKLTEYEDHDAHEDEDCDDVENHRAPSALDSHVVPKAHEAMRASRGISAHLQDPGSGFQCGPAGVLPHSFFVEYVFVASGLFWRAFFVSGGNARCV